MDRYGEATASGRGIVDENGGVEEHEEHGRQRAGEEASRGPVRALADATAASSLPRREGEGGDAVKSSRRPIQSASANGHSSRAVDVEAGSGGGDEEDGADDEGDEEGAGGVESGERCTPLAPDEQQRGFRLLHESLRLWVDFERQILQGEADLQLWLCEPQPSEAVRPADAFTLRLNCRRCTIHRVTVNGIDAPFRLESALDDAAALATCAERIYPIPTVDAVEGHRARWAREAALGELHVEVSRALLGTVEGDAEAVGDGEDATKPETTWENQGAASRRTSAWRRQIPGEGGKMFAVCDVIMHIEYETWPDGGGAHFVVGDDVEEDPATSTPDHPDIPEASFDGTAQLPLLQHMYIESRYGMARLWMPCVDTPEAVCAGSSARCPFRLEVTVPTGMRVVAAGELLGSYLERPPRRPRRPPPSASALVDDPEASVTRFVFQVTEPAAAGEILFAAGHLRALPDRLRPQSMTYFCVRGQLRQLVNTTDFVPSALESLESYFGVARPTGSFKAVFVGGGMAEVPQISAVGGIVIAAETELFSDRVIDDVFRSHHLLATALAGMWLGRVFRPVHLSDGWLFVGLAEYVGALCLRKTLGNTWCRLFFRDALKVVIESGQGRLRYSALERPAVGSTPASRYLAMLLVAALDRRAERKGDEVGRSAPAPKKSAAARVDSGEAVRAAVHSLMLSPPKNGALSVKMLVRLLERRHNVHLSGFVRQYLGSNAFPTFTCGYRYDSREHKIELALKQAVAPRRRAGEVREPTLFKGVIKVSVREPEDHYTVECEVVDAVHVFDIPCRTRKGGAMSRARSTDETAAAATAGGEATAGATTVTAMGDAVSATYEPVLWIRIDPEMEWVCAIHLRQSERAWMRQLVGERDVLSQMDCCEAMSSGASVAAARCLRDSILHNAQVHYRVRCAAALALARSAGRETGFAGLEALLTFYRRHYLVERETASAEGEDASATAAASEGVPWWRRCLPRPADFSRDLAAYYLQRALLQALGAVRVAREGDAARRAPTDAFEVLLMVLRYHNNQGNAFDDGYWVRDALRALVSAAYTNDGWQGRRVQSVLERYRMRDHWLPSHQQVVTAACIQAQTELLASGSAVCGDGEGAEAGDEWERYEAFLWQWIPPPPPPARHTESAPPRAGAYGQPSWILRPFEAAIDGLVRLFGDREEVLDRLLRWSMQWPRPRYACCLLQTLSRYGVRGSRLTRLLRSDSEYAMQMVRRVLRQIALESDASVRLYLADWARALWGPREPTPLLPESEYRRRMQRRRGLVVTMPTGRATEAAHPPIGGEADEIEAGAAMPEVVLIKMPEQGEKREEATSDGQRAVAGGASAGDGADSGPVLTVRLPTTAATLDHPIEKRPSTAAREPSRELDIEDATYVHLVESQVFRPAGCAVVDEQWLQHGALPAAGKRWSKKVVMPAGGTISKASGAPEVARTEDAPIQPLRVKLTLDPAASQDHA
ncbi:hypothetical protein CDCA_CDCA03G0859 [Cyanidium caldarium]|uniref:Transcription initiation factor TFIID subunit 2 n=1 Tax=Cyanidium caldarium TaxID=2771 RepID=A0AAV9IRE9_CYACA|nr:hypothetical protein CDCA_CDCA03G0859 [Cyanidium caldarium]